MNQTNLQGHPTGRLLSLDAFRGATMMSMVLVNNPGDWDHVYPPLLHADWHGCTFTDLIFPFFLFIVGTSMAFSFSKRLQASGSKGPLLAQIFRRTAIIFALGVFLNALLLITMPDSLLRIPGVLQRIALCYFFVGWMALYLPPKGQWTIAILLLAIYAAGMFLGGISFNTETNFCVRLDRLILMGHVWPFAPAKGFDPEGVWSTLTAVVTTLLGYRAGCWLRSEKDDRDKLIGLFTGGNACLLLAYLTWMIMPVNKQLWTVPYVLLTGGLALHVLGSLYYLIDMKQYRRFTQPTLIYGSNAIAIYVGSGLLESILHWIPITGGDSRVTLWEWAYNHLFLSWASPINASLAMGLFYVLVWLAIADVLYRRRLFIKV